MKRVVIWPQAAREALRAFHWYEQEREGLGGEFLREVDGVLELTRGRPSAGRPIGSRTRRALLRRFPYLVLYVVEPDRLVITGILHTHMHPRRWADRVQERLGGVGWGLGQEVA